jgi:hypothetical protein
MRREPACLLLLGFALAAATPQANAAVAPPVLKWKNGGCFSSWCQTGWYASPAVADLDGDGRNEVVWGSYDLVALDGGTGALRWRAPSASRVWPGVVVADLSGDGTREIVVGRSGDQVTAYSASGGVLWSRNPFGAGEVRTLAVDDLEADGSLETVVGRASGGATKQLHVFSATGAPRAGWPARRDGEAGYGWGMYNENVAVADLDRNGTKEIVGPTDTHYVTALDRNGNQLAASPIYGAGKVWSQVGVHVDHAVDLRGYANCGVEHRPNFADSAPSVADLDGDGTLEIVVVGNVYDCGTSPYTSLYHMPFVFRMDRTRWAAGPHDWTAIPAPLPASGPLSEDYDVIETAVPNPVLADLDGDGKREILFSSYDGRVHAWWLDKTQKGSWPYDVPGPGIRFASEPVVADLDGDGPAEVIFTSWPDKGTGGVGRLHVLSATGQPLQAVDLPAPLSASWTWNGALGAPTLANLDGDPDLEVVVGTVASGVVAYDLPNTAPARVRWATGRGSYKRTGVPMGASSAPFGSFDTPANGASGVTGAVPVTGWALDDTSVQSLEIWRSPVAGEPPSNVFVGYATFVPGARPDVAAAYPAYPNSDRAGWGYMLLTNMLPSGGNGSYTLHAFAIDGDGSRTLLGSKTLSCTNATATKPFGTLDTPAQGQTVSGSAYNVFGWALTPLPAAIPTNGSTIQLFVDGSPLGHPSYNLYRSDIATLFPGYANTNGAVGLFVLDTTALPNGLHTIAWSVTDDQGRSDGIGSRYFWVQN